MRLFKYIRYTCFSFSFFQYLRNRALMDAQINLCGLNRLMPQKVSYIYERYPSFKHVDCFAMAETVWRIIFFLKVIWMIAFFLCYIFTDQVSNTCSCYPVRPLAWKQMLIPVIFQSFPTFCQISFYQFHDI